MALIEKIRVNKMRRRMRKEEYARYLVGILILSTIILLGVFNIAFSSL